MRLVLASRSPQRRTILERLGVEFVMRPGDVDELALGDPDTVARENALRKATAAAPAAGEVVLAVDTIVALDGALYGKPQNPAEALRTLGALSGRTHTVISGLVLLEAGCQPLVRSAATAVSFRELDQRLLEWYVATGEWQERSGGYAVQQAGGALVRQIEGDYTNVVGLPLALLLDVWPELLDATPTPPRLR
ncbi:MAG TPA: Maf family protein [Solirubrobacteraceae bacterium]|nr:Maf family protein [Solirubrobacteraceae bacterium]